MMDLDPLSPLTMLEQCDYAERLGVELGRSREFSSEESLAEEERALDSVLFDTASFTELCAVTDARARGATHLFWLARTQTLRS